MSQAELFVKTHYAVWNAFLGFTFLWVLLLFKIL